MTGRGQAPHRVTEQISSKSSAAQRRRLCPVRPPAHPSTAVLHCPPAATLPLSHSCQLPTPQAYAPKQSNSLHQPNKPISSPSFLLPADVLHTYPPAAPHTQDQYHTYRDLPVPVPAPAPAPAPASNLLCLSLCSGSGSVSFAPILGR